MKIDMKKSLITFEIEWNPATTCNPERWDWHTLVQAICYEYRVHYGTDISVKLVEASVEKDFQEDNDK